MSKNKTHVSEQGDGEKLVKTPLGREMVERTETKTADDGVEETRTTYKPRDTKRYFT